MLTLFWLASSWAFFNILASLVFWAIADKLSGRIIE